MYLYPNENLDVWEPRLDDENGIESRVVSHLALRDQGIDIVIPMSAILNPPPGERVSSEGELFWGLAVKPEGYKLTASRDAVIELFRVAKEEHDNKKICECK